MPSINDVREYWENHPLLSYEIDKLGSERFFTEFDNVKRQDSDKYTSHYWNFDGFKDKLVLDVGCGPGWLTVNYGLGGASVYAIDLTSRAIELTKKHLEYKHVSATVRQGNAEEIPFGDNIFDLVVSSGCIHHTPDPFKAMIECYRVLKPGEKAKITLYHKGFLHSKLLFKITKWMMKLFRVKRPGANLAYAKDVDDFIRQYDGAENPVGIGKTKEAWSIMLIKAGFIIMSTETHFFPKRFLPFGKKMPRLIHRILDRFLGTMIYFDLKKPLNIK